MKEKEIQKCQANLPACPGTERAPFFNSFSSGRPTCLPNLKVILHGLNKTL